jgi:transcriptional regulator with XRE-family HTH domain
MSDQTPRSRTLAEKLDQLFRTMHPRGRGEYTYREVAAGIRAQGGPRRMSATYLWQLRTGLKDNPSRRHLEALATFFGVPVSYFFDDAMAARIDAELALLRALRDTPIRRIALRLADLSPAGLAAIADMVEHVRRLEGLPDGPRSAEPRDSGSTGGPE